MHGFIPVIHGASGESADERDTLEAAESVAAALVRLGYRTAIVPLDLDLTPLEGLVGQSPVAVFNLVEALRGDARLGAVSASVLDHLGLPFTGAGAEEWTMSLSKLLTKGVLDAAGIPTAPHWARGIGAPASERVIVKSVHEHASFGMDEGSIVEGRNAAAAILSREHRFGGRFFAESYVEGREFNVAVLLGEREPLVLPAQEILFEHLPAGRPAIVDYEAKWDPASVAYNAMPRRFGLEEMEPALAGELARLARECWTAFGLRSYCRVDFRVDREGRPFVLEVNVNPCIAPDSGFAVTAAEAGIPYDALIGRIVSAARHTSRAAA